MPVYKVVLAVYTVMLVLYTVVLAVYTVYLTVYTVVLAVYTVVLATQEQHWFGEPITVESSEPQEVIVMCTVHNIVLCTMLRYVLCTVHSTVLCIVLCTVLCTVLCSELWTVLCTLYCAVYCPFYSAAHLCCALCSAQHTMCRAQYRMIAAFVTLSLWFPCNARIKTWDPWSVPEFSISPRDSWTAPIL